MANKAPPELIEQINALLSEILTDYGGLELTERYGIGYEDTGELAPTAPAAAFDIHTLGRYEAHEILTLLLANMTPQRRRAVMLYALDHNQAEIAGIMGISQQAVSKLLKPPAQEKVKKPRNNPVGVLITHEQLAAVDQIAVDLETSRHEVLKLAMERYIDAWKGKKAI